MTDIVGLSESEHSQLVGAICFLVIHHTESMKEAQESARNFPRHRANCLRVAAHHQEQIYQAGELAEKIGARNGWPRPSKKLAASVAGSDTP